jgi:hypothetical protein
LQDEDHQEREDGRRWSKLVELEEGKQETQGKTEVVQEKIFLLLAEQWKKGFLFVFFSTRPLFSGGKWGDLRLKILNLNVEDGDDLVYLGSVIWRDMCKLFLSIRLDF